MNILLSATLRLRVTVLAGSLFLVPYSLTAAGPGGGTVPGGGGNQPGGGSSGTFTYDTFITDPATNGNIIVYHNAWAGYVTGATAIIVPSTVSNALQGVMAGCASLVSADLSAATGLAYLPRGTFRGCAALTTVTLPASIATIGDGAFDGCSNLTTITASGVTTIGADAFRGCTKLTAQPAGSTIGDGAFAQSGLVSATLSDRTVGVGVCAGCASLKSVDAITMIPDGTFNGCTNLVFDPAPCTSIGVAALAGLTNATIDLSSSVALGSYAFAADAATLATTLAYDGSIIPETDATTFLGRSMIATYEPIAGSVCRVEAAALVTWLETTNLASDYSTAALDAWLTNTTSGTVNAYLFAYASGYATNSTFTALSIDGTNFVWQAPDASALASVSVSLECATNVTQSTWDTAYTQEDATLYTIPTAPTAFARLRITPLWW